VRVVVTGGAGFIGANLCRQLVSVPEIDDVVALDDLSTGGRSNLDGVGARLVEGSILDVALVDRVLAGADAVVHLAARPSVPRSLADPVASHEVNATGTLNVLESARRVAVPHVVVASSSSVYGANSTLPKSEDLAPRPVSPYAASKLAAESYALAYASSFGLATLAFRFFNVFGPLQPAGHAYAALVPTFVDSALHGRPLTVHGDGKQTRDFTYVDTVAEIIATSVLTRATSNDPVNLAFGTRRCVLDVVAELEAVLGRELAIEFLPARTGDVRDSQADDTRLQSMFPGIRPVDFAVGLRRTVEWFERALPRETDAAR
jgi:UDP-glucose 4-epimerase